MLFLAKINEKGNARDKDAFELVWCSFISVLFSEKYNNHAHQSQVIIVPGHQESASFKIEWKKKKIDSSVLILDEHCESTQSSHDTSLNKWFKERK